MPKSLDASTKKALKLAAWCDTVKDMLAGLNGDASIASYQPALLASYETTVHEGLGSLSPHIHKAAKRSSSRSKPARQSSIYDNFMDYMFTDNSVGKGGISAATSKSLVQRESSTLLECCTEQCFWRWNA